VRFNGLTLSNNDDVNEAFDHYHGMNGSSEDTWNPSDDLQFGGHFGENQNETDGPDPNDVQKIWLGNSLSESLNEGEMD
jgi:hypothetical protein